VVFRSGTKFRCSTLMKQGHRRSSEWRRYRTLSKEDSKTLERIKRQEKKDAERESKELEQMSDEDKKVEQEAAGHLEEKMQGSVKKG